MMKNWRRSFCCIVAPAPDSLIVQPVKASQVWHHLRHHSSRGGEISPVCRCDRRAECVLHHHPRACRSSLRFHRLNGALTKLCEVGTATAALPKRHRATRVVARYVPRTDSPRLTRRTAIANQSWQGVIRREPAHSDHQQPVTIQMAKVKRNNANRGQESGENSVIVPHCLTIMQSNNRHYRKVFRMTALHREKTGSPA